MTQPSSLTKTFDTSLIDASQSFSSTETNTSGSSGKENVRPQQQSSSGRSSSPYKTVPTDQLYEQWASTYDTDGNVLQAVDDVQLHRLLPELVRLTCDGKGSAAVDMGALKILDLGWVVARSLPSTLTGLSCGWGSASLYFAEMFPRSQITAFSNSRTQKLYIDGQAEEKGLTNLKVIKCNLKVKLTLLIRF